MDYSKPGFWIAIGVGGLIICLASLIQQYTTKETDESINYRALIRDFCIGAFLTASAYMLLPDSIDSLVSAASEMLPKSIPFTQSGGAAPVAAAEAVSAAAPASDIELQFGPARF
jgi:hypothetical protein